MDFEVVVWLSGCFFERDLFVIVECLILVLVNEVAWCFHEGIFREFWAGDLGVVMGIGFLFFEGGSFCYCDCMGI